MDRQGDEDLFLSKNHPLIHKSHVSRIEPMGSDGSFVIGSSVRIH